MAMTPKQMQSELALSIKAVFEKATRRGTTLREVLNEFEKLKPLLRTSPPAKEKKKEEKKEDEKKPEHASDQAPMLAVLAKKAGYAQNGSDYIRSQNGRNVYQSFSHLGVLGLQAEERSKIEELSRFPGGPAWNFDPGCALPNGKKAGQRSPYKWEAHHILPGSAFYYESKSGTVFTHEQYMLLLQTDYDVNNGHNVIMLPKQHAFIRNHALIQHSGDHPNYTQLVMDRMKRLSDEIDEAMTEKGPHEDIRANFLDKLEKLEKELWKKLVRLGNDVFKSLFGGAQIESDLVRFGRDSNNRQVASLA